LRVPSSRKIQCMGGDHAACCALRACESAAYTSSPWHDLSIFSPCRMSPSTTRYYYRVYYDLTVTEHHIIYMHGRGGQSSQTFMATPVHAYCYITARTIAMADAPRTSLQLPFINSPTGKYIVEHKHISADLLLYLDGICNWDTWKRPGLSLSRVTPRV